VKPIFLASASPIRAAILSAAGVAFWISPSEIDERRFKDQHLAAGESPSAIAGLLAQAKAAAVSATRPGVVIGADQTLEFRSRLFDKTSSLAETRDLLEALRGEFFHLHAGVALAEAGDVVWSATRSVRLVMRPFSDTFLDGYLARNADRLVPSLGGFELEAEGAQLLETIEGDYFTGLGLPLLPLLGALRSAGALET
jgi:septum formation protein